MARALFDGYEQAYERFERAAQIKDSDAVFFALFETLNWCVSLDDYAREWWAPDGVALGWAWRERAGGVELVGLLNAVRYARNLVHHQWADALALEDGVRIPYTEPN